MKYARTETFEHTISGLLTKRAELLCEAEELRERIAAIRNDIDAMDRILAALGYKGDLDAMMPRQKRYVVFGRNQLAKQVLTVLRKAGGPLSSRQIAEKIMLEIGLDPKDRKATTDFVRRVGKALRSYDNGTVTKERVVGGVVWRV